MTNEEYRAHALAEAKRIKEKNNRIYVLLIVSSILVPIITIKLSDQPKTTHLPSLEETRLELIKNQFSSWDGSHFGLERYIKTNMNDPDSYEHVETKYRDEGDYLLISAKFRGNNAFGGKVINAVLAKVSLDGRILEIVEN